ncbi:hypothetical protein [Rhodopirellula halodulae]|uniref:hypothetical protein n=1 Tax=Rhodopirellula halodulae TaxID=2894198 RepID=UPI001E3AF3B9|nr:hypothetical protein [Rhodopirellula sp. JC737]MCC9654800.1 hypothetical protein [Rhodopirellula sp. JC737]
MLAETTDPLFPLPLTPLETFFILDETEACPLTSFVELHFSTALDPVKLQSAVDRTVDEHPLLSCKIAETNGQYFWHFERELAPRLLRSGDLPLTTGSPDNPRPHPFDLFKESGCRVWYLTDHESNSPKPSQSTSKAAKPVSRVVLQLHHVCCDGVAIRQILLSVLTHYARETSDPECGRSSRLAARSTPVPERLRERMDLGELLSKPPKKSLTTWDRLRNAYYFHFQLPASLSPSRGSSQKHVDNSPSHSSHDDPLRHYRFDVAESEAIQDACSALNVSLNELSIALLFQTFEQWEQQHGHGAAKRYRLLMPVDLRSRGDLNLPACNRLSFAFLGRRKDQCQNIHDLIASVREEVADIKATRVHLDFLDGLKAASNHPRFFRWAIRKSRRMTTSVLTYAGDISRGMKNRFPEVDGQRQIGDARLTDVLAAPPPRDNTNISLAICVNWGRICISASWNRNLWNATTTDEFLELYAQNWRSWLRDA